MTGEEPATVSATLRSDGQVAADRRWLRKTIAESLALLTLLAATFVIAPHSTAMVWTRIGLAGLTAVQIATRAPCAWQMYRRYWKLNRRL